MSDFLDISDLIVTRLGTAPGTGELATVIDITDIDAIADRQKNLTAQIADRVSKATGAAILILWQGFSNENEKAATPRLISRYNISVICRPIIQETNLPADDIMQSIIQRLWGWVPGGGHVFGAARGFRGGLVPDKRYVVYDCEVSFPVAL